MLPLLAGGLGVIYAAIFLHGPRSQRYSLGRAVLKTLPVACLALATALHATLPLHWVLAATFALSAVGDWALVHDGQKAFLLGLGSFLLAHFGYIWVLFSLATPSYDLVFWLTLAALLLYAALLLASVWSRLTGLLKGPVLVYAVALASMVLLASTLRVNHPLITVAAGFFLISDSSLALNLFRWPDSKVLPWIIWITYVIAQILLFYGFLAAL